MVLGQGGLRPVLPGRAQLFQRAHSAGAPRMDEEDGDRSVHREQEVPRLLPAQPRVEWARPDVQEHGRCAVHDLAARREHVPDLRAERQQRAGAGRGRREPVRQTPQERWARRFRVRRRLLRRARGRGLQVSPVGGNRHISLETGCSSPLGRWSGGAHAARPSHRQRVCPGVCLQQRDAKQHHVPGPALLWTGRLARPPRHRPRVSPSAAG